jgi:hypothetical protein
MNISTPSQPHRKSHPYGLVHRYGGITSALFVIVVCTTGLLLNHTDQLELAKKTVTANWLLDWYGIEAPPIVSYGFASQYASQLDQTIYLGTTPVQGSYAHLQGMVSAESNVLVATADQLIVITPKGELIEILDSLHGIPANIRRIGLTPDGGLIVDAADNLWTADDNLLGWTRKDAKDITWSVTTTLPPSLEDAISIHFRGAGLPLERILLDLHSGRIFGRAGPWLGDAVAILFILLAITGIWMWFKTRRRDP